MKLTLATTQQAARTTATWIGAAARRVLPDFRDLHIYGGLALLGGGLVAAWGPAGLAAPGLLLFYLGVWKIGGE